MLSKASVLREGQKLIKSFRGCDPFAARKQHTSDLGPHQTEEGGGGEGRTRKVEGRREREGEEEEERIREASGRDLY